ncbi:MAG: hypothetical protein IGNPGNKH_00379 [Sodalis sp. Ffu]|nr:MAG: hypothetical protein IGNPGNKH_00379 [Sodalis sp. Ffu]
MIIWSNSEALKAIGRKNHQLVSHRAGYMMMKLTIISRVQYVICLTWFLGCNQAVIDGLLAQEVDLVSYAGCFFEF